MKHAVSVLLMVLVPSAAFAAKKAECPKSISVDIQDLSSTKADDTRAVNRIYELGENQTDFAYIQTVLEAANKVRDLKDTYTRIKVGEGFLYPTCYYRGSESTLIVHSAAGLKRTFTATVTLGYIDYKRKGAGFNPISSRGYRSDLVTHLKAYSADSLDTYKNRKSRLFMDLNIEYPLGDYGSEGFTESAEIGVAKSVKFKVLE